MQKRTMLWRRISLICAGRLRTTQIGVGDLHIFGNSSRNMRCLVSVRHTATIGTKKADRERHTARCSLRVILCEHKHTSTTLHVRKYSKYRTGAPSSYRCVLSLSTYNLFIVFVPLRNALVILNDFRGYASHGRFIYSIIFG